MKNQALLNTVNEISKVQKPIIGKGIVGGLSIEVYTMKPTYVDLGSFMYKTEKERDSDFNELNKLLTNYKNQKENVC